VSIFNNWGRHIDGVKFGHWVPVKETPEGCHYTRQGFFSDGQRILQTHFEPRPKIVGKGLKIVGGKVEMMKPSGKLQRDPSAKYWQVT